MESGEREKVDPVRIICAYKTLAHKRRQTCEAERWG